MFVLISILLSLCILIALFQVSQHRQSVQQRKLDILILLRQILLLCRQHRSLTHQSITLPTLNNQHHAIKDLDHQLVQISNQLIAVAHFDNKPVYRIFQQSLNKLRHDWQERSPARNQIIHGKAIRHCMFLMDDIVIAWLAESGRDELTEEYHMNWQIILDGMEILTQLRIAIENIHQPKGLQCVQGYCEKMKRKLNQLSLICPISLASPHSTQCVNELIQIIENKHKKIKSEHLYQLTTDLSLVLSQVYDQVLSDITQHLYLPLPELRLN